MKKFLFLIAVCCLTTTATKAQDVLNEIVKTSLSITNDTTLSREVRKAAVFKYDAMSYLRSKVLPPNVLLEQKISADSLNACIKMLNEQAYAMNQYVTLYQKRLSEAKKRNKGMVRSLFKQATIDHKLFNDHTVLPRLRLDQDARLHPLYRLEQDLEICIVNPYYSPNRNSNLCNVIMWF